MVVRGQCYDWQCHCTDTVIICHPQVQRPKPRQPLSTRNPTRSYKPQAASNSLNRGCQAALPPLLLGRVRHVPGSRQRQVRRPGKEETSTPQYRGFDQVEQGFFKGSLQFRPLRHAACLTGLPQSMGATEASPSSSSSTPSSTLTMSSLWRSGPCVPTHLAVQTHRL